MASPSALIYAAVAAQVVPAAVLTARRGGFPGQAWVAWTCLFSLLTDVVARLLGLQGINTHWVSYVSTPVMGAAFLWGMSWWQVTGVERLAVRLAVPTYLTVTLILVIWVEDLDNFSRYAAPLHSLLLLATAIWTLVRRGLSPSDRPLIRSDWFWILSGLAIYGAATATFPPVAALLLADDVDLLVAAFNVRAGLLLLAFLAIAWGMACRNPAEPSGPSSSPPPWA